MQLDQANAGSTGTNPMSYSFIGAVFQTGPNCDGSSAANTGNHSGQNEIGNTRLNLLNDSDCPRVMAQRHPHTVN
jgi:hypothetical protein